MHKIIRLCLAAALAGLAGCATGPQFIAANVQASAAAPPGAAVLQAPRYRFEPTAPAAGQPTPAEIELMAEAALATVGAVRDDAQPNVGVRASGRVTMGWYDNSDGWGLPPDYWGVGNYFGFGVDVGDGWYGNSGFGWPGGESIPVYASSVALTLRDLASGQIVYDSRARHTGAMGDTNAVLAALFVAALQGYPNPPPGVRRVEVPLFSAQPAAPAHAPAGAAADAAK